MKRSLPDTARSSPKKNMLRRRILLSTRERFLRDGFLNVPVDEIAAELAMSKKTFYLGYPSKDMLVEEIIDDLLAEIRSALLSIQEGNGSFVSKLDDILTFFGQLGGRIGKPFLRDLQRQMPHLWDRIEDFRRKRINEHFAKLIEQGIREGHVRSTINPQIFIRSYIAVIEAIITPSVLMVEPYSAKEAVRGVLEIFFHGILTKEGEKTFNRLHRQRATIKPEKK